MTRLNELLKTIEYYDHLKSTSRMTITPIKEARNGGKHGQAYTGKKADSPRKFWERNLIFLVGFIFMICLANLLITVILIYFFLETLH